MKLAAVDVGSNAARLYIVEVKKLDDLVTFKKLEYIRFPLKLGNDAFTRGFIGKEKRRRLLSLLLSFKIMMKLHEVNHSSLYGSSALRDSTNAEQVLRKINNKIGLKLRVISGKKEAKIISQVLIKNLDSGNYIHLDVGGGSTEVILLSRGRMLVSRTFNVGSVRIVCDDTNVLKIEEIVHFINRQIKSHKLPDATLVGTGGNIVKILDLINGKSRHSVSLPELKLLYSELEGKRPAELETSLMLTQDRAQVIIPAFRIYLGVMEGIGGERMLISDKGLKDGMIMELYKKFYPRQAKLSLDVPLMN